MANQVHEKVLSSLMKDIFGRKLKPNEKLPAERELAKNMNVDRTSLRVALKQLESMNVLDIKPGDGIYVKDYLKNAGVDFLRILFSQEEKGSSDINIDKFVIDDVWEWWTAIFPEIIKLAARRLAPRDLKAMNDLFDDELENIKDRNKIIELEIAEQDMMAEVAGNMIFLLISNSSRPLRRKIVELFINCLDDKALKLFIVSKKSLLGNYLDGSINSADLAAEKYREVLNAHRMLVRKSLH